MKFTTRILQYYWQRTCCVVTFFARKVLTRVPFHGKSAAATTTPAYAYSSMDLGGGAVSYERGTLVIRDAWAFGVVTG